MIEKLLARYGITSYQAVYNSAERQYACLKCVDQGDTHKDLKLYVNIRSDVFYCQRCKWKGDMQSLKLYLEQHFGRKLPSVETAPRLASLQHDLLQLDRSAPKKVPPTVSPLPYGSGPAWDNLDARHYLEKRGVTFQTAYDHALLYTSKGFYNRRIILPITNAKGEYVTFCARTIDQSGAKKYLFPKGARVGSHLYRLSHILEKPEKEVWLTEGVFDALHCLPKAVATFGKHISERQIRLLSLLEPERIVLMWDWDAWAKEDEQHLWNTTVKRLARYFKVLPVKLPKPNSDPTNYTVAELEELVAGVQ